MTERANENSNIVALRNSLEELSFDQLLDEMGMMKLKLGIIIPVLFKRGREKSLTDLQIRARIKVKIDIPESTYRRYLPESAKAHKYPKRNKSLIMSDNNSKNDIEETSGRSPVSEHRTTESASFEKKSNSESGHVYRDWTLVEFVSRYEKIEEQNKNLIQRLEQAKNRISELEAHLRYEGIIV